MSIPFREDEELNSLLRIVRHDPDKTQVLQRVDNPNSIRLPGNPFVRLRNEDVYPYLAKTLLTVDLDGMAPGLWLVGTNSGSSISSLHEQVILGRCVIPTESARLHLLWYHDKVFIKPLPAYLLSHAFWSFYFCNLQNLIPPPEQEKLRRAAVGFVRSYAHLIRSELDFQVALQHGLIPREVAVENLAIFLQYFLETPDNLLPPRYSYGELRLSRLNMWSGVLLGRMEYFNLSRQYETYFSRYFQTLIFAFGVFSVVLSAMQVGVAVVALPGHSASGSWDLFCSLCKWTAILTLIVLALMTLYLSGLFVYKSSKEIIFALNSLWQKRRGKGKL